MNRLVKDLFVSESADRRRLFGLRCGQDRFDPLILNAGWYNANGERLGWGSLTAVDLRQIAAGLAEDEVFIVLSEFDSFWGIAYGQGELNNGCMPAGEHMTRPGRDYVADKCRFIVIRDRVFQVNRESWAVSEKRSLPATFLGGLLFESLTGDQTRQLIAERSGRGDDRLELVSDEHVIEIGEDEIVLEEMVTDGADSDPDGLEFVGSEHVIEMVGDVISLPEWTGDRR